MRQDPRPDGCLGVAVTSLRLVRSTQRVCGRPGQRGVSLMLYDKERASCGKKKNLYSFYFLSFSLDSVSLFFSALYSICPRSFPFSCSILLVLLSKVFSLLLSRVA